MAGVSEWLTIPSVIGFAGAAAIFDLRTRKIPNALILTGLVVALVAATLAGGTDGLKDSLAGFGTGFLLMLPGFLLDFTGAGDVKMLAVLGAFLGPSTVLQVFAVTALVGASIVILMLFVRIIKSRMAGEPLFSGRYAKMLQTLWVTGQFIYLKPAESSVLGTRMPLAPLAAAAVAIVLLFEPFGK